MNSLYRVIRLRRSGHKNHPIFQLVLTLKYKRNNGNYLKKIGFLNLVAREHSLFVDLYLLGVSLNDGAYLNTTVKKYLSKFLYNK